jgi:hypothetical protein
MNIVLKALCAATTLVTTSAATATYTLADESAARITPQTNTTPSRFGERRSGEVPIFDNGAPNYSNGREMTYWTEADDFTLDESTTLGSAQFSLLDTNGGLNLWDGSLSWWIYVDDGGMPGTLHANGYADQLDVTFDQEVNGWDFYDFSFEFGDGGVNVSGGTTYWLALHAALDWTNRDDLYWATTGANGTHGAVEQQGGSGDWSTNGDQYAFALYGVPAPGAVVLFAIAGAGSRRRRSS